MKSALLAVSIGDSNIALHKQDTNNPHAHILLTMREVSSEGFGKKNRGWNKKELLKVWRGSWATECNKALYSAGSASRITHKSLKAQGVKREPTKHLGKRKSILLKGGVVESCIQDAIRLLRKELKQVQQTISFIISPKQEQSEIKPRQTMKKIEGISHPKIELKLMYNKIH